MIEVKQVTKTYGKKKNIFTALDDVSFSVPNNTSVAIIGKSGSGKSTLMHVMSGLDRPQHGEILIGERNILALKAKQTDSFRAKQMGFVFQSFFVEAGESCYENVSLSLEMSRTPQAERRKRIEKALADVDLTDKIKSKAGDLSGGQKQRLAIARAIVNQPKLLFADEPTGNLDTVTSQVVEDLLFKYQKDHQANLIIVTHDEELAARCDMQIIISDGKISEIRQAKTKEATS